MLTRAHIISKHSNDGFIDLLLHAILERNYLNDGGTIGKSYVHVFGDCCFILVQYKFPVDTSDAEDFSAD
jgi:hypothetical protein